MASWLDWFDPRKSGAILDEAYKNSTLRGGNINRQLQLINRLDEQNDKARGIKVHTIPRDTRSKSQPKGSGNPGSLGILDPRVWAAMNKSRQNIAALIPKSDQSKTKVHPWEGLIPGIGAAEESAKGKSLDQLMAAADIPGAAKEKGLFSKLASNFSNPLESENRATLTKETSNTKDPIKLPEVEKGGSRWVGANSTWVGRDNKVIAPNIKDIAKNQVPSVFKDDGSLASVKSVQKEIAKSPSIIQSLKIQGTNVLNKGKDMLTNAIASLPKTEQLKKVGMFDGTKAGTAKGMNAISGGIELLAKLTQRKQKQSTAGMEGKGGDIGQVAVAAGIDPEDFYSAV
tara:strand:- start:1852 stop:2880 length:1029 start_codon:yes stop_codon:yes gene_type:complete